MKYNPNMYKTILFALVSVSLLAQKPITISGYVQDYESGENLIGASLHFPEYNKGTVTNKFGFFSISVTKNLSQIQVSYTGYKKENFSLSFSKDSVLVFQLHPTSVDLSEIVVKTDAPTKDSYQDSSIGRYTISTETIKKTPTLLGENDLLKTLQLLPGVQAGSEGTVGINVRGSTPDHNLILLDGITIYNINHLFGFVSIINSDAIASADFLKGNIPARYGGRLSSVLDVRLREGNRKEWKSTIGLSPIATRITIEGPIKKNKSSVLLSFRRTWLDAVLRLGSKIAKSDGLNLIGFYDLNAKWNYTFSAKNRLYCSFYTGQDKLQNSFKLSESTYKYGFNWGNNTFGLRWNHLFSQKLFGNLTANYTKFSYNLEDTFEGKTNFVNKVSSGIEDIGLKYEFDYFPSNNHDIKYGLGVVLHRFRPEVKQFKVGSSDTLIMPTNLIATFEVSAYVEDDFDVSNSLKINAGLHYANQFVNNKTYHTLQPRFSARLLVGKMSALKFSYSNTAQFLHLLTNSSVGLPTDLWVPVTSKILPEKANCWSLGYSRNIGERGYNFSVEAYYKALTNVLEYKEGTNFLNNPNLSWDERVSMGKATSKGVEFFLEKTKGKNTGWLSYTLSKTDRIFPDINNGEPFPFKYDRRHNLSINVSHNFTPNRSLSFVFTYTTGAAVNLAAGRFGGFLPSNDAFEKNQNLFDNYYGQYFNNLPDYNGRNSFRAPAYHRLDISYRTTKQKKYGSRSWILGVYNAYSRQNPFFLFYDDKQLLQVSLLPIIPSFTYERNF